MRIVGSDTVIPYFESAVTFGRFQPQGSGGGEA